MYAVYETKSPLLLGEKGFLGFSDDAAGKKGVGGRKLLGKGVRLRGVACSICGHDCNFRFSPVPYRIRAKIMSDPGHFFGVFVRGVAWFISRF